MRAKTEHDLQWDRIVAAVCARCAGPRGARRELSLAETADATRLSLAEAAEAEALLAAGEPLPLDGIRDVRPFLARLERMGAVDGFALRDVRLTLDAAAALRRFLAKKRDRAPRLSAACAIDPTLEELSSEIAAAVAEDGTLSDDASPELSRLRKEVGVLRARIVAKLDALVLEHAAIMSDRFHTIREGRYVLPVRSDAHERFAGIVHATSASGATLFVEPRALVERGNRLKIALAEMEREEARILGALGARVRERMPEVVAAVDALDHADLRAASARFGRDTGGRVLPLADEPAIVLRAARHPVLVLDGVDVVPNDLSVRAGTAIVLSGPNAGGKTVALKLLGLAALMARAGLPFPATEGSSLGFFDPIASDVGDEQSLERNLSTFSAHVRSLAEMLASARRGALVLLDELAGGTDPSEGAALACAVVEALVSRGAAVAVTTHYDALKAMATTDARLENASVGFDVDRLEPTFALVHGVPGPSSALDVALRFGLSADIVAAARRIVPEQATRFDELARALVSSRALAEEQRAALEGERRALVAARERLDEELQSLRERERDKLSTETEQLVRELRRARDELRRVRRELREAEVDEARIEEARKLVDEAERTLEQARARDAEVSAEPAEPAAGPISPDALVVGMRVFVPRLRSVAEVLEPPRKGRVRVAAGSMRLAVGVDEVRAVAGEPARPKPVRLQPVRLEPSAPGRSRVREVRRSRDNTVDVRGLRVEEAVSMTEAFVDRLYARDEPAVFVLHGLGTGALRDAIREHLALARSYVSSVRAATHEEGGDGVTVLLLE